MTRAGLLAEAKAWRAVAERIGAGPFVDGLCKALIEEYFRSDEGFDYAAAKGRLDRHRAAHRPDYTGTFVYAPGVRGPRVLAALWLALECEDEARALRGAP